MTRLFISLFASLFAFAVYAQAPVSELESKADEALWQQIRSAPNIVIVMRHAMVERLKGQRPTAFDPSGNCAGEFMLSAWGRDDAKAIGQLFKARGVDPHVVSSTMCRCRDTAMLAFGRAELDPAMRESSSGDQQRFQEFLDASTRWIQRYRGARPLVIVTHTPNIDSLTGEQPAEPEMIVTRSNEKGDLDVLGKIVMYGQASGRN